MLITQYRCLSHTTWQVKCLIAVLITSPSKRSVSNWPQIVISFSPCLFIFLFPPPILIRRSHSVHDFSCQDSRVKRSHFWSFTMRSDSWISLILSDLIRKATQTSASASAWPCPSHTETWDQMDVASLPIIFSQHKSWHKRHVKLFPYILLAELARCSKIVERGKTTFDFICD